MSRHRWAAAPATLALLLSGCGEDDAAGNSDAAQITAVARAVVTSGNAEEVCRTGFSADFVSSVYGDLEVCRAAAVDTDATDAATGASVTAITIDGDTATATVTEQGGAADGASGTWGFVRDAGGWQVAEWRIDYLRAGLAAQLGPAYRAEGPDDPFRNATVRACLSDHLQALADPEFRATAYQIHRRSGAGDDTISGWYADCTGGVSTLRLDFEDVLRQADIPAAVIECAVKRLRRTVSDAEIRSMGRGGLQAPPAAVQKRIENATVACVEAAQ